MTSGAARMLADFLATLPGMGTTPVLSGVERGGTNREILDAALGGNVRVRDFSLLDEAIEWSEDQIIFRFGGFTSPDGYDRPVAAGIADRLAGRSHRGDRHARRAKDLSHRRPHHHRRRSLLLDLLPAKRNGQREACRRRAARNAGARHGVRRNGAGRRPSRRRRMGRHSRALYRIAARSGSTNIARTIRRSASTSCAIWPANWRDGWAAPTPRIDLLSAS